MRTSRLQTLGTAYGKRFEWTKSVADSDQSVRFFEEALVATPEHQPERALRLEQLGFLYWDRYIRTEVIADLDESIHRHHEALKATPADDPDHIKRLERLASTCNIRFMTTDSISSLDESIEFYKQALDTRPTEDPEGTKRLQRLGMLYRSRFEKTDDPADQAQSLHYFQTLLNNAPSSVDLRLSAGGILARTYTKLQNWPQAYQAISKALSLIPLLKHNSSNDPEKQRILIDIAGIAQEGAGIALMAEKTPYEAMSLHELSRGVIMGSLDELRAEVSHLEQKHPDLAAEYVRLRDELDAATQFNGGRADKYHNASQKLDSTLELIRNQLGFSRFLLAPSEDEVKAAAANGPIVILSASETRSDALIVETSGIQALTLPRLHKSQVQAYAASLTGSDGADEELLEWLWESIAEPVLDTLGFTGVPENTWPRIWWVTSGPLASLPIHAAGFHSHGSCKTVLDRVVSSYSSFVRTLIRSHQAQPEEPASRPQKAVLVGMQELRHAPEEIEKLKDICDSMNLRVVRPQPRREHFLAEIRDCDIFHFAGHGRVNSSDPLESALLLEDGPLIVSSLFDMKFRNRVPFLAYLSACGTGQVKHDGLIDEGLHLISAYQLAGFKHVVGTLWEVNDDVCVDVAVMTYEWMGEYGMEDESVSFGLHHASRSLRDRWISEDTSRGVVRGGDEKRSRNQLRFGQEKRQPRDVVLCDDMPMYWVPFVHFGV